MFQIHSQSIINGQIKYNIMDENEKQNSQYQKIFRFRFRPVFKEERIKAQQLSFSIHELQNASCAH